MNYAEFKTVITEEISKAIPKDYKVESRTIYRINECKDALNIVPRADRKECAFPNFYLEGYYDEYRKGRAIGEIITEILGVSAHASTQAKNVTEMVADKDALKSHIIPIIINADANAEYLDLLPHRRVLDLAICYRAILNQNADFHTSTMITNDILEDFGITEDELHRLAEQNVKEFGVKVMEVNDITTVTNDSFIYGAYQGFTNLNLLSYLADDYCDDLYIIPSSLHEVFIVPSSEYCVSALKSAAENAIDAGALKKGDWLSNNIYRYSRVEGAIHIV